MSAWLVQSFPGTGAPTVVVKLLEHFRGALVPDTYVPCSRTAKDSATPLYEQDLEAMLRTGRLIESVTVDQPAFASTSGIQVNTM